MARYVLGKSAKLFYDLNGTTWTEVLCRDLTLDLTRPEIDTSERGMDWATSTGGLKKAQLTTNMLVKTSSDATAFTRFQNSFMTDEPLKVLVLNGPNASPSEGIVGSVTVINFSIKQPLNDVQNADVTCVFNGEPVVPEWVTSPEHEPSSSSSSSGSSSSSS